MIEKALLGRSFQKNQKINRDAPVCMNVAVPTLRGLSIPQTADILKASETFFGCHNRISIQTHRSVISYAAALSFTTIIQV